MATIGDAFMQCSSDAGSVDMESSQYSIFTPPTSPKVAAGGPKHKLITEGDIQVCRLNHTRTIVSKIMNSKYLRRWESHKLVLDHSEIRSTTVGTPYWYSFCQYYEFQICCALESINNYV